MPVAYPHKGELGVVKTVIILGEHDGIRNALSDTERGNK
jgi:hypothetical protein